MGVKASILGTTPAHRARSGHGDGGHRAPRRDVILDHKSKCRTQPCLRAPSDMWLVKVPHVIRWAQPQMPWVYTP